MNDIDMIEELGDSMHLNLWTAYMSVISNIPAYDRPDGVKLLDLENFLLSEIGNLAVKNTTLRIFRTGRISYEKT